MIRIINLLYCWAVLFLALFFIELLLIDALLPRSFKEKYEAQYAPIIAQLLLVIIFIYRFKIDEVMMSGQFEKACLKGRALIPKYAR